MPKKRIQPRQKIIIENDENNTPSCSDDDNVELVEETKPTHRIINESILKIQKNHLNYVIKTFVHKNGIVCLSY
jgi:hypothetical protein